MFQNNIKKNLNLKYPCCSIINYRIKIFEKSYDPYSFYSMSETIEGCYSFYKLMVRIVS